MTFSGYNNHLKMSKRKKKVQLLHTKIDRCVGEGRGPTESLEKNRIKFDDNNMLYQYLSVIMTFKGTKGGGYFCSHILT